MSGIRFITAFLKDVNVASVAPTSKRAVKKLCGSIDFSDDITVVEYGPGTGPFTQYLLENMSEGSLYIAIERNRELCEYLREQFDDPRAHFVNGDARDVEKVLAESGVEKVDHVISGIPFSLMPMDVRKDIIRRTQQILRDEGSFLVYQFSHAARKHLEDVFSSVETSNAILNIPPLWLYQAKDRENSKRNAAS